MQSRQKRTDSRRNISFLEADFVQIAKIEENIDAILKQNREKYRQIQGYQSTYEGKLYQPNENLRTQKLFKKQLLMKQLDRLMDQQTTLDKKLAQINFLKQQERQSAQLILHKQTNSYLVLRTIWSKHQKTALQCKNSEQRVQSLNFAIGAIKNTILNMKKAEEKQQWHQVLQQKTDQKYKRLLVKYQQSLMKNQQQRTMIQNLSLKLRQKEQVERELKGQIAELERRGKKDKKNYQVQQISLKCHINQLKQHLLSVEKKLQKLQKWKVTLLKKTVTNSSNSFKLYFDVQNPQLQEGSQSSQFSLTTSQNIGSILDYLKQNSCVNQPINFMNGQVLLPVLQDLNGNLNQQYAIQVQIDQQNAETLIPYLNLTGNNSKQEGIRRKMPTDRPLKNKNCDTDRFIGTDKTIRNSFFDLKAEKFITNNLSSKQSLKNSIFLNEQNIKKFVRTKNILNSSRKTDRIFTQVELQ